MLRRYVATLLTMMILLTGCQEEPPATTTVADPPAQNGAMLKNAVTLEDADRETTEPGEVAEERIPPTPPIIEDFQEQPKLSLFPRAGDFQPEPGSEQHPYWRTFIEHLVKVTGVAENQADGSRGWVFRSVNTIDSVGYFSPLKVEPDTTYEVSFKLIGELPEGASAGIGILEFDQFLWIGEQYSQELYNRHYRGVHDGRRVTGKAAGQYDFSFQTGPDTRMIHLVLFREGTHDRNSIMFDDISIK